MLKRCAKILFGILCLQTDFIILYAVTASGANSSNSLAFGAFLVSAIFFLVGLFYGISGIAGINKEPKE